MEQLAKGSQVLQKQEDGEGRALFFFFFFFLKGRALFLCDWWGSGEEIPGQIKQECLDVPLLFRKI